MGWPAAAHAGGARPSDLPFIICGAGPGIVAYNSSADAEDFFLVFFVVNFFLGSSGGGGGGGTDAGRVIWRGRGARAG